MTVVDTVILAVDPLLSGDLDPRIVGIVLLKVVVAFTLLLVSVMLMIWFERKLVADMHNRIGPAVAGPFGILQTLADGIKLFFKEDLIPDRSDRVIFKLAPYLSLVPAFLVLYYEGRLGILKAHGDPVPAGETESSIAAIPQSNGERPDATEASIDNSADTSGSQDANVHPSVDSKA